MRARDTRAGALALVVIAACSGAPDDVAGAGDAATTSDGDTADAELPDSLTGSQVRLADTVHDAPGASGSGFGDPTRATNGVRGGGTSGGSLDVYSLNYGTNPHLALAWSNGRLRNEAGADLAVFENPFATGGGAFMDHMIVEVSRDGLEWRAIAHDYVATDELVYSNDPTKWPGFAGRTPVLINADTNVVDPFDPQAAGGDAFDLDDVVGDDAESAAIRADGIRFVRLVAAPTRTNPDTGQAYVREPVANGADIDGVYGRHVVPTAP